MVDLRKITILSSNMEECIALDVAPEQKEFVYSNAVMLALAFQFNSRGTAMECRAIYAEDRMIGLIAYNYYVGDVVFKEICYRIRPVMIDKSYWGKGYEEATLQKILEEIRTKPHGEASVVFVSCDPEEKAMVELYESIGFNKTGMDWKDADENPDNNDIIMRMCL